MKMIETVWESVSAYLQHQIDGDTFIRRCRQYYQQALDVPNKTYALELIGVMPFLHEFGFFESSDDTLRVQVEEWQAILSGTKPYVYSAVMKLDPPGRENKAMTDLWERFDALTWQDIAAVFTDPVAIPATVYDVLYDQLCDLVSNTDLTCPEESTVNCIGGVGDPSLSFIKDKTFTLLTYLLGIKPFMIQIHYLIGGNVLYAIL